MGARGPLALAILLLLFTVVPAVFIIVRELYRRAATTMAAARLDAARQELLHAPVEKINEMAKALERKHGRVALERALVLTMQSGDEEKIRFAVRVFESGGFLSDYNKRVRSASTWSERAHAAKILGLVAHPSSTAALVAALRDPHEDTASVKSSAAEALARLKDAEAIPFLVRELGEIDERSSPAVAEAIVRFGPLAVAPLLETMDRADNPLTRVWAARILGRIQDPAAVEPLMKRLSDRHDLLRVAAAEALGALGDKRAIQLLVQATLRDPAGQVRAHAAEAVAKLEGAGAIDILIAALSDPDYATRIRALEAFESISLEDTSALEGALRDPNLEVRKRAALALERVGYVDKIAAQLAEPDPELGQRAYVKLVEIGRAGLVESLSAYLHHESFQVRARVATAVGELGATRLGPFLLKSLEDPVWPVRAAIAEAIGRLRPEGAVPALAKLLADAEEPVQEAAAHALTAYPADELKKSVYDIVATFRKGNNLVRLHMILLATRIDMPEATEMLVQGARDPNANVRLAAIAGLSGRAEDMVVPALVEALTDTSLDVRMGAVGALGSAASVDAFEGLLKALPAAPPEARDRIADALARAGRAHLFNRMDELLASPEKDVRIGIAWTLGKLEDERGIPYLHQLLRDGDAALRASAAGALAKIETKASLDAVLDAVGDPDPKARAAVVNAIARLGKGDERAVRAMTERLRDPDRFIRNRAAVGIARIASPEVADARLAGLSEHVEAAAITVGYALIEGDAYLAKAMDRIGAPGHLKEVQAFIAHEGDVVKKAFRARLAMDNFEEQEEFNEDELIGRYEQLLRTSLDAHTRRVAVEGLSRMRGLRVIEILADALTADPQQPVRIRAAEALAIMQDDEVARDALLRAISDPVAEVATVAIRALRTSDDTRVAAALFARLGSGAKDVSDAVEDALASIHEKDLMPFYDRMMGVDTPAILISALGVLRRVAHPDSIFLLRELIRSKDRGVRSAAVHALAKIPSQEALEILYGMVSDPEEAVRLAVVDAIASPRDAAALMRISGIRADPSPLVRSRLAELLESYSMQPALRVLEPLVTDPSPRVRAEALATMLSFGEPESLSRFVTTWAKVDLDTRRETALVKRGAAVGQRLAQVLAVSPDPDVRESAVIGVSALAFDGHVDILLSALRDPAPHVRVAAIRGLAVLNRPELAEKVAELVKDPDSRVRETARKSILRTVS